DARCQVLPASWHRESSNHGCRRRQRRSRSPGCGHRSTILKLLRPAGYCRLTVCFSGKFCDDPPTMKPYSPGSNCQPFCSTLKMERYFGSISTVTSLDSPGFRVTLLQPTRRFGGSAADAGREAYTSATSAPDRKSVV